jgi:hypothetical protein
MMIEDATRIRGYGDKAVIRLDNEADGYLTPAGLLIGTVAKERPRCLRGEVLSRGPRCHGVEPGERVIVRSHAAYAELEERRAGERPSEIVIVGVNQLELAGDVRRVA